MIMPSEIFSAVPPGLRRQGFRDAVSFRRALQRHLGALENADLRALAATVSDDTDICVLVRDGLHVRGKRAILDFHRSRFEDPAWEHGAMILWSVESLDTAMAVVVGHHHESLPAAGPHRHNFRDTLVFNKHDDGWHLVFSHRVAR